MKGRNTMNNEKKRPVPSEAQYQIMAMRFSELIYKDWFEKKKKNDYLKHQKKSESLAIGVSFSLATKIHFDILQEFCYTDSGNATLRH